MPDKPKIVIASSELPPGTDDRTYRVSRRITDQTHDVAYSLRAPLDLPFRDFLALFLWDEDLGIRLRRISNDCDESAEVEILWRKEDELEITVGIPRTTSDDQHPTEEKD